MTPPQIITEHDQARAWILHEAERRLLLDAEFKARAVQAANVVGRGGPVAVAQAAVALVVAGLPLGPGGSLVIP